MDDMCYEERVLYRLFSGLHTSTNIHINWHYYPPRKGVRDTWGPNPARYVPPACDRAARDAGLTPLP